MENPLTDEGLRRLVFLKGLLMQYRAESGRLFSDADRASNLLALDYSIQGLLHLILAERGRPASYPGPASRYMNKKSLLENQPARDFTDFSRLCDEVTALLMENREAWGLEQIPFYGELVQIHRARNECQHSFTIPSQEDLRRYHSYVDAAFKNIVLNVLGRDFGSLDYSSLVSDPELRQMISNAGGWLKQGNYVAAVDWCALAVERAISRRADAFPIYRVDGMPGGRLIPPDISQHAYRGRSGFLFTWLQFTAIGLNHHDAERFYLLTPSIDFAASGVPWLRGHRTDLAEDDAEFCMMFATEVASRLERLGLAPGVRTGEWFESDETAYMKRRVPNWDPGDYRSVEPPRQE